MELYPFFKGGWHGLLKEILRRCGRFRISKVGIKWKNRLDYGYTNIQHWYRKYIS
jgi:hypothetical protein